MGLTRTEGNENTEIISLMDEAERSFGNDNMIAASTIAASRVLKTKKTAAKFIDPRIFIQI